MDQSQATVDPSRSISSDVLDAESFASLFASVYESLWLIAAGITGDRTSADDVVQDAALIALKKLQQFTVGSNFRAWMARIVRFTALNYARKKKQHRTNLADPVFLDHSQYLATGDGSHCSPAVDASGRIPEHQISFDDEVLRALNTIGEIPRACLLLRCIEQLSYSEISQLLEIPEGTAMSHVHRTKQTLRKILNERFRRADIDGETRR